MTFKNIEVLYLTLFYVQFYVKVWLFQVYNIVIRHLYISRHDHHTKSSNCHHAKLLTLLLTIFPFTFFTHPLSDPGNHQFFLCFYEPVFVHLILLLKGILKPQFVLKFHIFFFSLHGSFLALAKPKGGWNVSVLVIHGEPEGDT